MERRGVLRRSAALCALGVAGCLGDAGGGGQFADSTTAGDPGDGPTADARPEPTPPTTGTTDAASGGAHEFPYDLTIEVRARPVRDGASVPAGVPTVSAANLTANERSTLVEFLENGSTATWSGRSDGRPPERIRVLVAAADRLPPSPFERDPSEAWRIARSVEGYVVYEGRTYRVWMVKVAP